MINEVQEQIKEQVYDKVQHPSRFFQIPIFDKLVMYEDYMPIPYDELVRILSDISSEITHSNYKRMIKSSNKGF